MQLRNNRPQVDYADIERRDRELLEEVQTEWARGAEKAGKWLRCRPGCYTCCVGPFPVTVLDAKRLQEGLLRLSQRDSDLAGSIQARARSVWRRYLGLFPGDSDGGLLTTDEEDKERFLIKFKHSICPVLHPETGLCELYEYRPLGCRSYGLPSKQDEEMFPHCVLCFRDADEEQIEICRIEPDPRDLEGSILDEIDVEGEAETLIAFAIASVQLGD